MSKSVLTVFSSRSFIVPSPHVSLESILSLYMCVGSENVLISYFYVAVQFYQYYLLKTIFSKLYILEFFVIVSLTMFCGFISRLSSVCPFLWQYHSVLIIIALYQ